MKRKHMSNTFKALALMVVVIGLVGSPVLAAGLRKNSVKSKHIKDGQVLAVDIGTGAVGSDEIAGGAVTGAKIANNAISGSELAVDSVTNSKIFDNSVTTAKIASNAVTSGKIADDIVGRADLANDYMWAKVSGVATFDGATLLRGLGAIAVGRVNTGQYTVTFDSSITVCGWTSTLNDNGAGVAPTGFTSIEQSSGGDPNTLRIRIFDSTGALADVGGGDGFTVQVMC